VKDIRIERWHSSQASFEVHFFIAGTQIYVCGFNPELIDEAKIRKLVDEIDEKAVFTSDNQA
jgi:hypothetical protein